jgi:hypothetical protein
VLTSEDNVSRRALVVVTPSVVGVGAVCSGPCRLDDHSDATRRVLSPQAKLCGSAHITRPIGVESNGSWPCGQDSLALNLDATDGAICATRRGAWVTGFDCGAICLYGCYTTAPVVSYVSESNAWGF